MSDDKDRDCLAMLKVSVTVSWCKNNQHQSFCGNRKHQDKPPREISFYQAKRDGNKQ